MGSPSRPLPGTPPLTTGALTERPAWVGGTWPATTFSSGSRLRQEQGDWGGPCAKGRVEEGITAGAPRREGLPTKRWQLDKPASETASLIVPSLRVVPCKLSRTFSSSRSPGQGSAHTLDCPKSSEESIGMPTLLPGTRAASRSFFPASSLFPLQSRKPSRCRRRKLLTGRTPRGSVSRGYRLPVCT